MHIENEVAARIEIIPVLWSVEFVANGDSDVTSDRLNIPIAAIIKALAYIITGLGLVDKLNDSYNIATWSITLCQCLDCLQSLGDCVTRSPIFDAPLTRIVESVLPARGAMEVNHHLQAELTSPRNGFVQVCQSTLHIGIAGEGVDSPVANADANMVHTGGLDGGEVIVRDEGCIMVV